MPKGVFNPYRPKKPKKDFRSPTDNRNPYDTEFGEPVSGNIKLDGDSHILELKQLEIEDIPSRLGDLIDDVIKSHRDVLLRHGIELVPADRYAQIAQNTVCLPTPKGYITAQLQNETAESMNKPKVEVEVFRRLAHALREVPREILKKHKARIIVRA